MSRVNAMIVSLLAVLISAVATHGATNTNFVLKAEVREPVKIGHHCSPISTGF